MFRLARLAESIRFWHCGTNDSWLLEIAAPALRTLCSVTSRDELRTLSPRAASHALTSTDIHDYLGTIRICFASAQAAGRSLSLYTRVRPMTNTELCGAEISFTPLGTCPFQPGPAIR